MNSSAQAGMISSMVTVLSVLYPLTTLPQIVTLFSTGNAAGISAVMWALYILFGIPFLLYAIQLRIRPLIINHALWIVMYAIVLTGVLIYQ